MRTRFYLLLVLTLSTIFASAQIHEPVKWETEGKVTDKSTFQLTFAATIDNGWHIYDQNLPDGGPVATHLVVENTRNTTAKGKMQSNIAPTEKYEEMFQMNLRWFDHPVTFTQTFSLTDTANYLIEGFLEYMACDNANCLPPTKVPFKFSKNKAKSGETPAKSDAGTAIFNFEPLQTADTTATQAAVADKGDAWQPVIEAMNHFGETEEQSGGNALWGIFCIGLLGGLIAIATPCVWPIIPMTVSFFLHKKDGSGKRSALLYGLSIIVIYVGLGLLLTLIFGADALNALSTNAVFNIFLFLLLVVFAISFFGGFNLSLPASWSTSTENKADQTTGLLSIVLMAFTLVIVSFSCTGPIIGTLLVSISSQKEILAPTVGMLGFAIALAGPFTIFALFPNIMKKMPRSGGWMNSVKVLLGFFELAFALKFLSVADLAYGWHLLDREVFIALWIAICIFTILYLIGTIRFPGDDEKTTLSVPRLIGAIGVSAFALYLIPGLWGAPLKAISAFAPPQCTQDFNLYQETEATANDYDEAIRQARATGKPLLIDFSGYGCVNCRKMEATVWNDPQVKTLIKEKFILVSLFVDDKNALAEPLTITENGSEVTLKTVGEKWSYLQRHKFGANAQPFYVPVDANGNPLNHSYSFSENATEFAKFLKEAIENDKLKK